MDIIEEQHEWHMSQQCHELDVFSSYWIPKVMLHDSAARILTVPSLHTKPFINYSCLIFDYTSTVKALL